MAPAGDATTSRGLSSLALEGHPSMMTDQPARVTPAEISDLLRSMAGLSHDTPLGEQIAWHERKAVLLSRIAADLDTPEAHAAAAEAWDQLAALAAEMRRTVSEGGRQ
jgi:hypothetical protein